MSFLDLARSCVARGWAVVPAYPDTKRPRLKNWTNIASRDDAQLVLWAKQWPDSLVSVVTGPPSGVIVVDVDMKNGKDGAAEWDRLCAEHNDPDPKTYTVRTPSGGFHLYFLGDGPTSASTLAPGIDTRGTGGQVIAYANVVCDIPLAPVPAWLLARLGTAKAPTAPAAEVEAFIVPAEARRALTHAELLHFVHKAPGDVRTDALAVAYGKAWGVAGARDTRLFKLCYALMSAFPWLDPDGTAVLFERSCAAVSAEDDSTTTVEWVAEKLAQRIAPVANRVAKDTADLTFKDRYLAKLREPDPTVPPPRCAHDEWILGTPQGYFLNGPNGYEGPYSAELTPTRARDVLAGEGLELTRWVKNELAPKSATTLLHEYGKVPRAVEYVLYGDTRLARDTLLFRALNLEELAPEYDPQIARWLELLSGAHHESFLDWLATMLDFSNPTCALMLKGYPGIGKGLLVDGISALFRAGKAVPFSEAIGAYSAGLIHCPLVVADECLAAPPGVNAVDEFKKLVGDSSFRVANKYVAAATLRGCVRTILNTNHHGGFRFGRELTVADVAALDQRVLMLEPARATADYLTGLGGRAYTTAWVQGGGLAKHVLWLQANRQVTRGARFLVEGRGGLAELLAGDSKGTAPVVRAIVYALKLRNDAAILRDGAVLVNKRRIVDQWATLNTLDEPPSDMGAAWELLCVAGSSNTYKEQGKTVRRQEVRLAVILAAAQRLGLEDILQ